MLSLNGGGGMTDIRVVGDIMIRSRSDAVSTRESLNSYKQKGLSHYSPALKFLHLLREEKRYSLYAAAEQVDHFHLSQ